MAKRPHRRAWVAWLCKGQAQARAMQGTSRFPLDRPSPQATRCRWTRDSLAGALVHLATRDNRGSPRARRKAPPPTLPCPRSRRANSRSSSSSPPASSCRDSAPTSLPAHPRPLHRWNRLPCHPTTGWGRVTRFAFACGGNSMARAAVWSTATATSISRRSARYPSPACAWMRSNRIYGPPSGAITATSN